MLTTNPLLEYSIYIALGVSIAVGFIGWGLRALIATLRGQDKVLQSQSQALAILVTESKRDRDDVSKYHNEILDHKMALHTLNQTVLINSEHIDDILDRLIRNEIR